MAKLNWSYYSGFLVLGGFIGFFSGIFGVGGGIVTVPSLVLILGLSQATAQGLSLAVMVPAAIVNSYTYFKEGSIDSSHIPLVVALVIGAIIAGPFGSKIANNLPSATLKGMFAIFMVAAAVRMMPNSSMRSMGSLLGVLLIAIGIRLLFART